MRIVSGFPFTRPDAAPLCRPLSRNLLRSPPPLEMSLLSQSRPYLRAGHPDPCHDSASAAPTGRAQFHADRRIHSILFCLFLFAISSIRKSDCSARQQPESGALIRKSENLAICLSCDWQILFATIYMNLEVAFRSRFSISRSARLRLLRSLRSPPPFRGSPFRLDVLPAVRCLPPKRFGSSRIRGFRLGVCSAYLQGGSRLSPWIRRIRSGSRSTDARFALERVFLSRCREAGRSRVFFCLVPRLASGAHLCNPTTPLTGWCSVRGRRRHQLRPALFAVEHHTAPARSGS